MFRTAIIVAAALVPAVPALAQENFPACQSQRALEQILDSNGSYVPDECRNLSISVVEQDDRRLCVIDFSGVGEGVLGALRDAALPEQWWVRCDQLEESAR